MSTRSLLLRSALLATLLLIFIPGVSGWTFTNWSVSPSGAELPPGTPVTAGYSLSFDSWMTGTTFEMDNTLVMYTDLSGPHWVVTSVEPMEDQPPIIQPVPVNQGSQVKLSGFLLSYSKKQYHVDVQLTGKTPALNKTATISIVKLQEVAPGSKTVSGSLLKKETTVVIPTPEPTAPPAEITINMTPAETIEITPVPTAAETTAVPAKKVTYSPGPDPLLVAGMLAGLLGIAAVMRRRT
jgi:hypothetical protein